MHQTRSRSLRPTFRRSRRGRRGVSDMVAVILAVAITVVLAAVLFALISSLTHSTGTAPLGSQFAWGTPSNDTAIPATGCVAAAHYCYHIELVVTGSSVNVIQFTLALQSVGGSPVGWPTSLTAAGGVIEVISPTTGLPAAQYWPLNSSWQLVSPFKGVLGAGYTLVVYCGGAAEGANQGLLGLKLVAIGTNGYSGTVPSEPFP